jgi:hypothetical protein
MAAELAVSPETVRGHVQNSLMKLGVHSRLKAAAFRSKRPIHLGIARDLIDCEEGRTLRAVLVGMLRE